MRVDRAVGTGLHDIHPLEFRICSHGSTTACLCSERAGSNSFSVLKTRKTQTGDPKMPGLEGRAFYPLFPTSFAKYFQMLSNIHSARMYAAQALFANELWDGED